MLIVLRAHTKTQGCVYSGCGNVLKLDGTYKEGVVMMYIVWRML